MNTTVKIVTGLIALAGLTACGGGGGSSTGGGGGSVNSFAELQRLVRDINDETENYELTEQANIPTTGSANYDGYVTVFEGVDVSSEEIDYIAVGRASLEVDFDNTSVSGSASDFFEVEVEGIDLETSEIEDASGTSIAGAFVFDDNGANLTGSLTKLDGEVASYEMSTDEVDFEGPNGEAIFFDGFGTSEADGRSVKPAGFGGYVRSSN